MTTNIEEIDTVEIYHDGTFIIGFRRPFTGTFPSQVATYMEGNTINRALDIMMDWYRKEWSLRIVSEPVADRETVVEFRFVGSEILIQKSVD